MEARGAVCAQPPDAPLEVVEIATLFTSPECPAAVGPRSSRCRFRRPTSPSCPAGAGSVAFPDSLHKVNGPDLIAEPTSGAVK